MKTVLRYYCKTCDYRRFHGNESHPRCYTFEVRSRVRPSQRLPSAVEEAFKGTKVASVNIDQHEEEAQDDSASIVGYTSAWKKAIVTLKADSKPIEFFDGMTVSEGGEQNGNDQVQAHNPRPDGI